MMHFMSQVYRTTAFVANMCKFAAEIIVLEHILHTAEKVLNHLPFVRILYSDSAAWLFLTLE